MDKMQPYCSVQINWQKIKHIAIVHLQIMRLIAIVLATTSQSQAHYQRPVSTILTAQQKLQAMHHLSNLMHKPVDIHPNHEEATVLTNLVHMLAGAGVLDHHLKIAALTRAQHLAEGHHTARQALGALQEQYNTRETDFTQQHQEVQQKVKEHQTQLKQLQKQLATAQQQLAQARQSQQSPQVQLPFQIQQAPQSQQASLPPSKQIQQPPPKMHPSKIEQTQPIIQSKTVQPAPPVKQVPQLTPIRPPRVSQAPKMQPPPKFKPAPFPRPAPFIKPPAAIKPFALAKLPVLAKPPKGIAIPPTSLRPADTATLKPQSKLPVPMIADLQNQVSTRDKHIAQQRTLLTQEQQKNEQLTQTIEQHAIQLKQREEESNRLAQRLEELHPQLERFQAENTTLASELSEIRKLEQKFQETKMRAQDSEARALALETQLAEVTGTQRNQSAKQADIILITEELEKIKTERQVIIKENTYLKQAMQRRQQLERCNRQLLREMRAHKQEIDRLTILVKSNPIAVSSTALTEVSTVDPVPSSLVTTVETPFDTNADGIQKTDLNTTITL